MAFPGINFPQPAMLHTCAKPQTDQGAEFLTNSDDFYIGHYKTQIYSPFSYLDGVIQHLKTYVGQWASESFFKSQKRRMVCIL